jgi:hypothetical protein
MATLQNTTINSTGFLQLPRGTTAQRPVSPANGDVRFNTDTNIVEWYDGTYTSWFPAGVLSPIATGGTVGNITQNGKGYRTHTFTTVGTTSFTVTRGGLAEYLIVGGGGCGADVGGGGAGGVRLGQILLSPQTYSIVVGAGAPANPDDSDPGVNGDPSLAFNLVAAGGGGAGGGFVAGRGMVGGSGGGGGRNPSGSIWNLGGAGRPDQGFEGGTGINFLSADWEGGGGGGGGGEGHQSYSSEWGGDGGPGINSSITGTFQSYGGGGGSGSNTQRGRGGLGGGGQGKLNSDGTSNDGGTNTGGGGGGGWSGATGAGGSGIVIVRYRTTG